MIYKSVVPKGYQHNNTSVSMVKRNIEQQWDKMIITYKIKHNKDFSAELKKAKQIAEFAIKTRSMSSKDVACFRLKAISNQILRKIFK